MSEENKPEETKESAETAAGTESTENSDLEQRIKALEEQVTKWKALSRSNEDKAKSNAEKAKAWDENKAQLERVPQLEKELELKELKTEIARKHGVDPDILRGETEEELEASFTQFEQAAKAFAFKDTSLGMGDTEQVQDKADSKDQNNLIRAAYRGL